MSTLSLNEFSTTTEQAASQVASGWSEAAARYANWVTVQEASRILTETEKFNAFAAELGKSYRTAAENAVVWAQAARDAGRTGIADIMDKYAAQHAAQADRLLNTMLDQKANLNLLAAEARSAVVQAEAALGRGFGRAIGPAFDAYQMLDGALEWAQTGSSDKFGGAAMGVLLSAGMGIAAATLLAGFPIIVTITAVAAGAAVGSALGNWMFTNFQGAIDSLINTTYRTASTTRPAPVYYDPLAIDLDGDGIETTGIGSAPVLFDHNADGIRTGTGWVTGDDVWLVLDRDGNGTIDSGRELFGVDYVKSNGQHATSGFDALRDLDANADGIFDSSDAAFTQVRLWQDLNQDGISQSNELFTLADKGVASISLSGTTANTNLGNGNVVSATGTVTRTDGSTTSAGAVDLNLSTNAFYREFTDDITQSETALALPEMGGAGWVRDLREAMSLGTTQADALVAQVQQFAAGTTKAGQMAQLDDLIRAWAASNEAVALKPVDDPLRRFVVANNPAMSAQMQAIIPVLEIFNGLGVAQAGMQNPVLSTITAPDGTSSPYNDKLSFGAGIAEQDLWFSRSGDHLLVQVLGDGGQVQVNNWYGGNQYWIEQLQLSDGQRLLAAQVDSLVSAMAAFAPPAPGQTALTAEQQSALAPVIAANWN